MAGVSLIIPCFNHGATLERAVRSALPRDGLGELIIVDDCSTDAFSWPQAQALMQCDPRIRVLQTPCNSGPGAARNLGAQNAQCDYLSFLDADDELIDDFFSEAIAMLETQPEMGAVKTDELFFDPVKGYILPATDPRYQAAVLSSVPGLVIRRDVFFALGGFPEDAVFRGVHGGEDVAFMQGLIEHFQPLGRIARPCYKVHSCAGSHVDRFLQTTRVTEDDSGFEFVRTTPEQAPDGPLARALAHQLEQITIRYRNTRNEI